jgi:hypothetical protein
VAEQSTVVVGLMVAIVRERSKGYVALPLRLRETDYFSVRSNACRSVLAHFGGSVRRSDCCPLAGQAGVG